MSTAVRGRPASNGSVAGGPHGTDNGGTRLRLHRNPLRLAVSPSLWRAAWFLAAYVFAVGWVLFAAAFTASVTAAVLLITLTGPPSTCRSRPRSTSAHHRSTAAAATSSGIPARVIRRTAAVTVAVKAAANSTQPTAKT